MSQTDQDKATAAYGKVVARTWRDAAYKAKLLAEKVDSAEQAQRCHGRSGSRALTDVLARPAEAKSLRPKKRLLRIKISELNIKTTTTSA